MVRELDLPEFASVLDGSSARRFPSERSTFMTWHNFLRRNIRDNLEGLVWIG